MDYNMIYLRFGPTLFSQVVEEAEKRFQDVIRLERRQQRPDGGYEIDPRESGAGFGFSGINLLGFVDGEWQRGRRNLLEIDVARGGGRERGVILVLPMKCRSSILFRCDSSFSSGIVDPPFIGLSGMIIPTWAGRNRTKKILLTENNDDLPLLGLIAAAAELPAPYGAMKPYFLVGFVKLANLVKKKKVTESDDTSASGLAIKAAAAKKGPLSRRASDASGSSGAASSRSSRVGTPVHSQSGSRAGASAKFPPVRKD